MKKIMAGVFVLASSTASVSTFAQNELFKPSHGGQELKKSGLSYEVVRKPKEIIVYPPPKKENAPVPSRITLKFKNKKGIEDEIQLKLMPMKEREPGMNIYSAPVPASVYISGGLSFDLDVNPKK